MTDNENTQDSTAMVKMMNADELRSVTSFEDAMALAQETWGDIADASDEIGDGFTMLEDKDKLRDVPFIALGWMFTTGDFGGDYLIMRLVTDKGDKYVVTDGSTGLCAQVREYQDRSGKQGGLFVKRGLRRSDYEYTDDKTGEKRPASTHYLNV